MTSLQKLRARKAAIDAMPHTPTNRRGQVNSSICRPVLCVTENKRFASLHEASKWLTEKLQEECSASAIGQAIRRGKPYKKFEFKLEKQ